MLFWTDPEVAVAPPAQIPEFFDFRMIVLFVVFHRQPIRIVDSDVAAQTEEDTGTFVSEEFGI